MATLIINQNKNPEINQDEFDLNEYGQIHEMADWQGVLDIYLQLKKDVYPKKVFVVLDDVGQAMYTSMHATQNDDLYFDKMLSSEIIGSFSLLTSKTSPNLISTSP